MAGFPKMIYHVVEEPIIVFNEEDLKSFVDKGWSVDPIRFSEVRAIKVKIAHHKAELRIL